MKPNRTMKATVEEILEAHGLLNAWRSNPHYAVKIANPPYMDLVLERHGDRVVLAHYWLHPSGDMIANPDLELADIGGEDWLPIAIQQGDRYCVTAQKAAGTGNWLISKAAMASLRAFLRVWIKNLREQGYGRGTIARARPA